MSPETRPNQTRGETKEETRWDQRRDKTKPDQRWDQTRDQTRPEMRGEETRTSPINLIDQHYQQLCAFPGSTSGFVKLDCSAMTDPIQIDPSCFLSFFLSLFLIPFLSLVLISLSGFEVILECVWTAHGSVFDVCVWPAANPPFPCFSAFSACPVSDPWLHHNCLYKSPPISSSSSLTLSAFLCSSPS